jgi:hypothetical protein
MARTKQISRKSVKVPKRRHPSENPGPYRAPPPPPVIRKKNKFRPGTIALRQIKKYRSSTNLLIRKAPFQRLVREILH